MKYNNKATYWKAGPVDPYGNPTWDGPNKVWVRWEDRVESFIDDTGTESRSRAIIYPQIVVSNGDRFIKGWSDSSTPPDNAYDVRTFNETPNLRGTRTEYRAVL